MLVFNRPTFKTGVMILKVTVAETEYAVSLRPADKGTTVDFGADPVRDAFLAKYPAFLAMPA